MSHLQAVMSNTNIRQPKGAAILLLGIPPSILCGIDLLSFTTSPNFHGIKDIPPGFHFIFTSVTSSLSVRDGFWFHVPELKLVSKSALIVRKWDPEAASLAPVEDAESFRSTLEELWEKGLSPYRQSAEREAAADSGEWTSLTEHISSDILTHLTRTKDWSLTSASCAEVDQDHIPGLNVEEMNFKERELGVLGIDLKRTWPEGAVGRDRTDAATDRSWALNDLTKRWQGEQAMWGAIVLGQMEVCFVMVLTIANYSCLEEWKRCLSLVLTCKKAVIEHEDFFARFLKLLTKQIQRFEDVDGGLFDMNDEGGGLLKHLLKGFKRTLEDVFDNGQGEDIKDEMEELERVLKRIYNWDLSADIVRKGGLELEDGETIEMELGGFHQEEESGEYAPVVVDLQ